MEQLANAIKAATDLHGLRDALVAFDDAVRAEADDFSRNTEGQLDRFGLDLCALPTFGGDEPNDTAGVWSWDAKRLLVGEGRCAEWRIIERTAQ